MPTTWKCNFRLGAVVPPRLVADLFARSYRCLSFQVLMQLSGETVAASAVLAAPPDTVPITDWPVVLSVTGTVRGFFVAPRVRPGRCPSHALGLAGLRLPPHFVSSSHLSRHSSPAATATIPCPGRR